MNAIKHHLAKFS